MSLQAICEFQMLTATPQSNETRANEKMLSFCKRRTLQISILAENHQPTPNLKHANVLNIQTLQVTPAQNPATHGSTYFIFKHPHCTDNAWPFEILKPNYSISKIPFLSPAGWWHDLPNTDWSRRLPKYFQYFHKAWSKSKCWRR